MITKAWEAWVLHKRWRGDTSAQVTFFTREQGVVRCLYKGGRTPKKQSLLQAFTPLWLAVNVHRDGLFVRQVEIMSSSLFLEGHRLFAGLYVNELIHHILQPSDSNPAVFDAYVLTLQNLASAADRLQIEVTLRRFEWMLLTSCGYQMSLTHDAHHRLIVSDHRYRFVMGEGFVLSEEGISGSHILAFADGKLDDIEVLKTAKWIMRCAIDFVLDGKPIKTRELVTTHSVSGNGRIWRILDEK